MTTQDIFIVEDSALVRERLLELLCDLPETSVVGVAAGADQAIRDILADRPDVVLLDLSLAQGSGFDVLRAVHELAPEIDVYMLSSFATEPYRRLAARLGARDFFDKSTEFERVRDTIAARLH
jgi:DNA-binding NarL/FixJ family response regulator